MPLHFLDSSAIVRRYLPEIGHRWVRHVCRNEPIAVSLIVVAEVSSSLARLVRERALSPAQRDKLIERFDSDLLSCPVIDIDRALIDEAGRLLRTTPPTIPLRTLDAIQLAAALDAFRR